MAKQTYADVLKKYPEKCEYWLTNPLTARQLICVLRILGLVSQDYDENDIIVELVQLEK